MRETMPRVKIVNTNTPITVPTRTRIHVSTRKWSVATAYHIVITYIQITTCHSLHIRYSYKIKCMYIYSHISFHYFLSSLFIFSFLFCISNRRGDKPGLNTSKNSGTKVLTLSQVSPSRDGLMFSRGNNPVMIAISCPSSGSIVRGFSRREYVVRI